MSELTELEQESINPLELIADAAYKAGFRETQLLIAIGIAMAESSGKPEAVGDENLQNEKWGPSIGLWQIRSLRHPETFSFPDTLRIAEQLRDPYKNAEAAYAISENGTNFGPWSTFMNNAYRIYINDIISFLDNNLKPKNLS